MDTDSTLMYYLPFESRMARLSMQDVTHLFPVEDLPYVYRIRAIQTIVPWILLAFGLIGNVFVLCVFLRKKPGTSTSRFQISSNGFCFCALAIADSFALIFMMMRSLMLVELIKNLTISCKLLKFTYYVSLQISSWCMVLLTIDRLIAVTFVFKYQVWTKNFLARKVLIGIVLGIILLNSHILLFVTSEISEDDLITTTTRKTPNLLKLTTTKSKFLPNYICTASKHPFYNKYFYSHWDTYHAIIYGGLPFIIILISTGLIILRLYRYRNHRMFKATSQSSATDDSDRFRPVQITVMLLSVASLFLLFTGPISIYMTFFYYNLTWMRESKQSFIRTILTHFAYCNNVVNFYVYLALSSEFRREWLKIVSGVFYCCKSLNPKNVTSVCTTTTTTLGSNENLNRAPITRTPKLNTQTQRQTQSTSPLLKTELTSSNVPPVPKPRRLKPVKLSIDSEKPLLERNKNTAPKRDPYNSQLDGFINSNSTFV